MERGMTKSRFIFAQFAYRNPLLSTFKKSGAKSLKKNHIKKINKYIVPTSNALYLL
jgi:hypothetical protein